MEDDKDSAEFDRFLAMKCNPKRSQSMYVSSKKFSLVPTIHPKDTNKMPSPLRLAMSSCTEITEAEDSDEDFKEPQEGKNKHIPSSMTDKEIVVNSPLLLNSSLTTTTTSTTPTSEEKVAVPNKRKSSILLSLQKKRNSLIN